MGKILLTDVDGVLLEWKDAYVEWMWNNPHYFPNGLPDKDKSNSLNIEDWLGVTHEETRASIEAFNSSEYFGTLKPYADAVEYVEKLYSTGHRFVAISACKDDEWTHNTRLANLKAHFGDAIADLHCVGIRTSKVEHLSKYRPTYWFEDSISHAYEGQSTGHTAVLMDHYYNASDKGLIRAKNWKEIYHCILEDGCTLPNWIG